MEKGVCWQPSLCIMAEGDSRPFIPLVPLNAKASKKLQGTNPRLFLYSTNKRNNIWVQLLKSTYSFAGNPMRIYWGKSSLVVSAT